MEKTLYSYELYSHPDKLLKEHLHNVKEIGLNVFQKENLKNILNEGILKSILLFHDFGKASIFFQDKLVNRKDHNVNLTYHSDISALACLLYLEKEGFTNIDFSLAFLAIKKHHGNFNDNLEDLFRINEDRKEYLEEILNNINFSEIERIYQNDLKMIGFKEYFKDKIQNLSIRKYRNEFLKNFNNNFDLYTRLNIYFSILVYSDKQDCIFNKDLINADKKEINDYYSVDNFKNEHFKEKENKINEIREKSYKEVESNICSDKKIFSINLPTGSGKTLTALNASLKLLEKDKSLERIIYCLPFTSIIDQNADIFQKVLKTTDNSILLKHHHLTELNYSTSFYKDEIFKDNQAENLIESWESKIIVTTFFQLLNTIFSGSNKLLKKFNKIQNSIIILDEVQSIPRKYWLLINRYFKYLTEIFNIKLILVTATMPMIFSEIENEIFELAKSKKDYFNFFNRICLDVTNIKDDKKINIADFCNAFYKEIIENETKSFLIILNTINSSLSIYKFLKEKELDLIYLSSNIIPKHRLERINEIKNSKNRCIVISTQVVEAGVDIDFDIVYRDLAPLDSIFQACGRCNRNGKKDNKGKVKIVRLVNEKGKEYSNFIYDSVNLSKTLNIFKSKEIINENEFFKISNLYFNEMKNVTETNTSSNIIFSMQKLNYKDAFYDKNSFRLIEDKFFAVSVFIEIDEESTQYLEEYNKLLKENKHSFDDNIKMKRLFNKMSQYIINVAANFLHNIDNDKIFIIKKDELNNYYSPSTGFIRSPSATDYFF